MSEMSKKGGHTMKLLITLSLAALTLYAFVKRTYKYASVEDQFVVIVLALIIMAVMEDK